MQPQFRKGMAVLSAAAAALATFAAGLGVFQRGSEVAQATSVRGETYTMLTDGVYAFNAQRIVAEAIGWDLFTLFFVVPALVLCVPFIARNSVRGRLVAAGLLGYLFYQYLAYALTWAYGPLFPVFVVTYSVSLIAAMWLATSVGIAQSQALTKHFPRRGVAALTLGLSAVLTLMWGSRIITTLQGDFSTEALLGQTTLVIQALDLGLVVPAGIFTGVAVLQRRPVGKLVAPIYLVYGAAMALAILGMLFSVWSTEGVFEFAPTVLFATVALAAVVLVYLSLRVESRDDIAIPRMGRDELSV